MNHFALAFAPCLIGKGLLLYHLYHFLAFLFSRYSGLNACIYIFYMVKSLLKMYKVFRGSELFFLICTNYKKDSEQFLKLHKNKVKTQH